MTKKTKWFKKGQSLVEFAITIPVAFCMATLGADMANMALTQHRLHAASYEASKIIAQSRGNFFASCTSGRSVDGNTYNSEACLSDSMSARASQILSQFGLNSASAVFKDFTKEEENGRNRYFGVEISYPYSVTLASMLGFQTYTLKAFAPAYYETLNECDSGVYNSFGQCCPRNRDQLVASCDYETLKLCSPCAMPSEQWNAKVCDDSGTNCQWQQGKVPGTRLPDNRVVPNPCDTRGQISGIRGCGL